MLRITLETDAGGARLRLEGDLAGTGVCVLEEYWLSTKWSFSGSPVRLDLSSVARVDDAGRFLLALLYRAGVRLETSGVEMKALVDTIAHDWPLPSSGLASLTAAARKRSER